MIFVTVGTHEQPFNRLIEYIDTIKRDGLIEEDIVMQIGYSTYVPQCCTWQNLYPFSSMAEYVEAARIVITHGGPSSFIMPLQIGKIPIVVPRQKKYGEHVNDHQVTFTQEVERRMGNIITVPDIRKLGGIIRDYDEIATRMKRNRISNNIKFNEELEGIVNEMLEGKRKKW